MKTNDFINDIKDAAISLHKNGGMFASVTIAQAICESASGTSGLTKASNNLFGIKGEYNGNSVTYQTKEWVKGSYVSVYARFRKYPSFAESIIDHDNFIKSVKLGSGLQRYAAVLSAATPAAACKALQTCGYATSPTYPKTLTDIIKTYNLTQYDIVLDPSVCPYSEPTTDYMPGKKITGNDGFWFEWQMQRIGYTLERMGCTRGVLDGIIGAMMWPLLIFEMGQCGETSANNNFRTYLKSVPSK